MLRFFLIATFILLGNALCNAQSKTPVSGTASTAASATVKSSPAFAEVLLRKTDLEATLEDLLVEYTDEFPKVKETRHELGVIQKEWNRLLAVNQNEAGKLTQALGKLIVRKAELETNLWALLEKYGDAHDEVKRAKRKVAAFEKAIKEILP